MMYQKHLIKKDSRGGLTEKEEIEFQTLTDNLPVKSEKITLGNKNELRYNTLKKKDSRGRLTEEEEIEFNELKALLGE